MRQKRNKLGSALVITAISLLVIIFLGVAFYFISKMLGAGKEVSDGVDAVRLALPDVPQAR